MDAARLSPLPGGVVGKPSVNSALSSMHQTRSQSELTMSRVKIDENRLEARTV